MTTTQTSHPWRASTRTVFQAFVAFAAMWVVIVETLELDPGWQWVSASLAVSGGITRVMALPQVERVLRRIVPWLAADPSDHIGTGDVATFDAAHDDLEHRL